MLIKINNEDTEVSEGMTLGELAAAKHLPSKGVAMAVNNELAPCASWAERVICAGDNITIVKAFCGG